MKTTSKFLGKTLFLSLILLSACKEGPPGPAGEKGSQGEKGDTGSANVVYGGWVNMDVASFWYTVSTNIWEASFAANLSQEQLDKGVLLVYGKDNTAGGTVKLLPYNPSSALTVQSAYRLNRVVVQQIYYTTRPAAYTNQGFQQFRYVLVPGGVPGSRKAALDYTDYEAVKKTYNIPD